MTPETIEQLHESRVAMLASVERDIGAKLAEALEAKLHYEHATLLEMAEASARELAAKKLTTGTLNTRYFLQKTFDSELFYL